MIRLALVAAAASVGLAPPAQDAPGEILLGVWGGDRVVAVFSVDGAKIQQDCAEGSIPTPVRLDRARRFEIAGVYAASRPGPEREDETGPPPATYSGQLVRSTTLRLTIHPAAGAQDRSYVLERGAKPKLVRCY
jgi:hypothetical protein